MKLPIFILLMTATACQARYVNVKRPDNIPDTDGNGEIGVAEVFDFLDIDGDGFATKDEMVQKVEEQGVSSDQAAQLVDSEIEKFDKNGDGKLTVSELTETSKVKRPDNIPDRNGNGEIDITETFDFLDTNNNGYVSKNELIQKIKEQGINHEHASELADKEIEKKDQNDDGKLTISEMVLRANVKRPDNIPDLNGNGNAERDEVFDFLDIDGDGFATKDEMVQKMTEQGIISDDASKLVDSEIEKFDKNGDGKLTASEIESFNAIVKRPDNIPDLDGNGNIDEAEVFDFLDIDGDGFATKDEMVQKIKEQGVSSDQASKLVDTEIAKFDKNGDGKLTASEVTSNGVNENVKRPDNIPDKNGDGKIDVMESFDFLDTDDDGFVTKDEMVKKVEKQGVNSDVASRLAHNQMRKFDKNDDDKLTLSEMLDR